MKTVLFTAAAMAVVAFHSDTCDVVSVGGVRINKADYDADQLKDSADRQYGKLDSDKKQEAAADDTAKVTTTAVDTAVHPDIVIPPTPSAPDFNAGGQTNPTPLDPETGAAIPTVPSPGQLFVLQEGRKYFVTDQLGAHTTGRDGIDEKGYASQDLANAAILALPH